MATHIIHCATFRSYIRDVSVTLGLLRNDAGFLVRFHRDGGAVFSHPCRSADEAEALYCRILHYGMTGQDLPAIAPDPLAYLRR